MARTINQWKREVERVFETEGGTEIGFEIPESTHMHVTAKFVLPDLLGPVRIRLAVSVSPSATCAGHHVRRDLRRLLREKKEQVIKEKADAGR